MQSHVASCCWGLPPVPWRAIATRTRLAKCQEHHLLRATSLWKQHHRRLSIGRDQRFHAATELCCIVAKQMGTRFAYPSLVIPGCPPPVNNLLTQTRVTLKDAAAFKERGPDPLSRLCNNVAVPGIASADPTAPVGPNATTLTELFLGGETMVQKALDARPTFATVWVGNNDILQPAISGLPSTATPVPQFITNYAATINALLSGAPKLKGVLIAVVQVASAPLMFQAGRSRQPSRVSGRQSSRWAPGFSRPRRRVMAPTPRPSSTFSTLPRRSRRDPRAPRERSFVRRSPEVGFPTRAISSCSI